jgi:hypothetical protein
MDISAFTFGFIYVILIVVIFSDVCNALARFTGFSNVWRFSHWLPKYVTRLNYLPWMPFWFLLFDALVSDAWVWRPTTLYTWPAPRGLACDVIVSQHPTFPTPPYPIFVCMCVWERERERHRFIHFLCPWLQTGLMAKTKPAAPKSRTGVHKYISILLIVVYIRKSSSLNILQYFCRETSYEGHVLTKNVNLTLSPN